MTLNEFINKKPECLRLGQWFVNCYWKGSDEISQKLYVMDGLRARQNIHYLMNLWQWDSLPDTNTKGGKI